MAAVDWPYNLCVITLSEYTLEDDENVRRTPFDDGLIAQRTRNTRVMQSREFQLFVKQSNVVRFQEFMRTSGAGFFNFRDWVMTDFSTDPPTPAAMVDARVRGGRIALRYVEDSRLDGERYFEGRGVIEGFFAA